LAGGCCDKLVVDCWIDHSNREVGVECLGEDLFSFSFLIARYL
jgi:hypothetical protein